MNNEITTLTGLHWNEIQHELRMSPHEIVRSKAGVTSVVTLVDTLEHINKLATDGVFTTEQARDAAVVLGQVPGLGMAAHVKPQTVSDLLDVVKGMSVQLQGLYDQNRELRERNDKHEAMVQAAGALFALVRDAAPAPTAH